LPHEISSDLGYYKKSQFKKEYLKTTNLMINGNIIGNKIKMDKVLAFEGNKEKLIEDFPNYLNVEFEYNSGGIGAPKNLQKYFSRVFEEFINTKECFNDTFLYFNIHIFYYCKNNKGILSKIKSVFPRIVFISNDLKTNFTLDIDDLFVEKKDYVFCLLYFKFSLNKEWKLGKPFLKKYQFSFNYDKKYITYYYKISEPNEDKIKYAFSSTSFWIILCITILIVSSIINFLIFRFYLFSKLFRKKRANELDDEEFDYISKEENDENCLIYPYSFIFLLLLKYY